jgi:P4 family phage/plasmid primase-like protien
MEAFLKNHLAAKGGEHTHTKIGDAKLNVFGGCYFIPPEDMNEFYALYKKSALLEKKETYLTEKQPEEGPLLIDLDFRYDVSIEERQHTKEHVVQLIEAIVRGVSRVKIVDQPLDCYVMEKPNPNLLEDKTKDGIHLLVNVKMDVACKLLIRNHLIKELPNLWADLPLMNSWEDVVDESVIRGYANWQLFGSRKPGNEAYQLKYIFSSKEGNITESFFSPDWVQEHFLKLTARNPEVQAFPLNPSIQKEYDAILQTRNRKTKVLEHSVFRTKLPEQLNSKEEIQEYMTRFMEQERSSNDYRVREAYDYCMILPEEYWGDGSYAKWVRVGWALKNTDPRLFVAWVHFSSQWPGFDYSTIPDLYDKWCGFNSQKDGLTLSSIIYWAKISAPLKYKEIHDKTIGHFIEFSSTKNTEYDMAMVLYQMYKDRFVCVSIKNKIWYEFCDNCWKLIDDDCNLTSHISTTMYAAFMKMGDSMKEDKQKAIYKTAELLKKTKDKGNIMKEAMEIFYDREFYAKLNKDCFLIGCNNCVVDFKAKEARKGRHDDYISMNTKIDYHPLSHYEKLCPQTIADVRAFMEQLFPNANVREYMWEHLASTLLGNNLNQSFNVYIGSGKNGKSKLVELMTRVLGQYKGTVPISLVTQKRTSIGNTSSEIYQLIGTRYAVMQEPSKGDVINEGVMKEITGGDPIVCRALFKDSVTFIPQFKLAVCTNNLFDIKSNDDGTWRRIRVVNFESKFTHKPYNDPEFPVDNYPFQFMLDTALDEKFDHWAPVMLSLLVEKAYETQGRVTDCEEVLASSNRYRQSQDIYLDFINQCIQEHSMPQPCNLKITAITDAFKNWYSINHGGKTMPLKELKEYLSKKFGSHSKEGWSRLSLIEGEG